MKCPACSDRVRQDHARSHLHLGQMSRILSERPYTRSGQVVKNCRQAIERPALRSGACLRVRGRYSITLGDMPSVSVADYCHLALHCTSNIVMLVFSSSFRSIIQHVVIAECVRSLSWYLCTRDGLLSSHRAEVHLLISCQLIPW